MGRNWTNDDVLALMYQEDSPVEIHGYIDGRSILHTPGHAWKWDYDSEVWVEASREDMLPTPRPEKVLLNQSYISLTLPKDS